MKSIFIAAALALCFTAAVSAQPRPIDKTPNTAAKPAPATFEARYEGGIFGNSSKEKGTLKIDDVNERVIFYRSDKTEMFSIPYSALLVIYPDSKEGISKTGNVMSRMPLPGAQLFGLLGKSTKYLVLRYDDQDVEAEGTANFKFDEKDLLLTFLNTLGPKAKMVQRGDAYYRSKKKPVF